jgi:methionine aminopeptidase
LTGFPGAGREALTGFLAAALTGLETLTAFFTTAFLAAALAGLVDLGVLRSYRPLVAPCGQPIAQAEHTLYVGRGGIEVLTL